MQGSSKINIEEFIDEEKVYFSDIFFNQKDITESEKAIFRKETISERKLRISTELFDLCDQTIAFGPFKGLKISRETWWGSQDLGAMALGLYEKEILDIINDFEENQFDTFIDIGAADGYYGVGMLNSKIVQKAICFEASEVGQKIIKKNFGLNGSPGQIEIFGSASNNSLKSLTSVDFTKAIILIDIEGAELEIVDAEFLSQARGANIIIEVHNWVDQFAAKYEKMLRAIDRDFNVHVIEPVERPTKSMPILRSFSDENRALIASEGRPCLMRFILLKPKK